MRFGEGLPRLALFKGTDRVVINQGFIPSCGLIHPITKRSIYVYANLWGSTSVIYWVSKLLVTYMNSMNDFQASPLSTAHLARRTPSFHLPPPVPNSVTTSPVSPWPISLVLASHTPAITNKAAVFINTKCNIGSSLGNSLRSSLIKISAFSCGSLPGDTSDKACCGRPKSDGSSWNSSMLTKVLGGASSSLVV